MFAADGYTSRVLGAVRGQYVVTITIIALVVLYRLNAIARFEILDTLTQPWYYATPKYQLWRYLGLFFVVNSGVIQAFFTIFQLYSYSKGVEVNYFGGDSLSYAFFIAFGMVSSIVFASVLVARNDAYITSLFPALRSFILYTWAVVAKDEMSNYAVFTVQCKYVPLISLALDVTTSSPEMVYLSMFGFGAAHLYCSIDCDHLDPLFSDVPMVGGKLWGRKLLGALLGAKTSTPHGRGPARPLSDVKKKRLSTSSSGNFKGQGRRLHDGKSATAPRGSIFSKIGLAGSNDSGASGSGTVRLISSESLFYQAIAADKLVIVDFFATWCSPCKKLAPYLEKFASEHKSVSFYKVDVDQMQFIAAKYDVFSMPTVIAFRLNKEKSRVTGLDLAAIQRLINSHA